MNKVTSLIIGVSLCGVVQLFPLTAVPSAFSGNAIDPDADLSPAALVALYMTNKVALVANRDEEHSLQIEDVVVPPEVQQALETAAGPNATSARIAAALEELIKSNPELAIVYTVAAIRYAGSLGLPRSTILNIVQRAVETVAAMGEPTLETVARLIGFGGQIADANNRTAAIAKLRLAALNSMPGLDAPAKAVALDNALVNAQILTPVAGGDQFDLLASQVNEITMESQLLTTHEQLEMVVFQAGSEGFTGGIGLGTDPFATSGAIDTPGNPGGLLNQPGEELPDTTPAPTATPIPTPQPPDS